MDHDEKDESAVDSGHFPDAGDATAAQLAGPTQEERDKKIAVHVGGSAAFRQFIREELIPQVRSRYHPAEETAIVGESLAGLFIVETFLLEPDLFDTYIEANTSCT